MCSIIGYYGDGSSSVAPVLVRGLKRMEYRGYDSVGVATKSGQEILLRKGVGKVAEVNMSAGLDKLSGSIGIGHTRWATHGKVTDANAHPHASNSGSIAVVHNGIIENFAELKENLVQDGVSFKSETDTEVIANQLQKNYAKTSDVKETLVKTLSELRGHYAFVVMFKDGTLAAARRHRPLIIGIGKESYFLSSDVLGFIEQTDEAIYMDNEDFVIVDSAGLQMYSFDGTLVKRQITKVSKEFSDAYKGDYAHFTLKEISEQPDTILRAGKNTEAVKRVASQIKHASTTYITGSGTSYNSALIAQYLMSKYAGIKTEPVVSSELPHSPVSIEAGSILVAISQSGESADVLEAADMAKKSGARVFSIVNMMTSSLVQESELSMGINCGPEIGVAATKSFTSQLGVIYKITEMLCNGRIHIDFDKISDCMSEILSDCNKICEIAKELRDVSDIYVLGRGMHYPIASEAALKLKEMAYVHAEGILAGELKHGPLALMDSSVYAVIINPDDSTYDDTLTSAREIRARGAKIIGISDKNSDVYNHWIKIPKIDESVYPIIEIVAIQLLSYYLALEKDTDPDYPRNLAKSVTVK